MFYRPPRNFYINQKYVRIILEGVKEKSKLFKERHKYGIGVANQKVYYRKREN
jgi:hypothetical protein